MTPVDAVTIARDDLSAWVELLGTRAKVIAPTPGQGGDVMYAEISSPDEALWEFQNSLHPPKQFLLPQTDPLVNIRCEGRRFGPEPIQDDRKKIFFNLRSCDLKAFIYLQRVHARDLPDRSYLRRVENATLVSLTCGTPCSLGFCTCCDAGPFLRAGFDLQMTNLGDRMLVEVGSDKGRALLEGGEAMFRPATPKELAERQTREIGARTHFGAQTCHFGSAMRRVSTGRVQEELWETMSDWCLECGGCTLVCPTCYCFNVQDRRVDDGWMRCRMWDSCQYAAFTLEASGHNPRPVRKDRMKRRFFHKVSAQYYLRDGDVGCVGCGRCIKVCMGTTDMPAVVKAIRTGEWNG